ncbi:carbohydrate ABC transporter permease [Microbacterium sp. zg.Y1090]|uniref:carbohydrate ABC transporter permease n=1 Tax=Microbacterium TaxID=33882 RepID=UPI00214BC852|nr:MULTISPECIES: carbohydrate ABC transporter permease [unclassified Microbacterium]MCR2811571.1 carbohydrate ABC transporter permease [Microbacterium sp. zg.Y1084]MCR2819007.1 carbohydrate ABC transporter permease [Microbacterium sp. zg.Y1090]MDL5487657.1 carbohydrate ABC transporter permease [Microbacterium sp. zg-Y1211]WIM27312.1 carbohydrate ABC transporter permease [Microbacterium sp. zg-Y1090]
MSTESVTATRTLVLGEDAVTPDPSGRRRVAPKTRGERMRLVIAHVFIYLAALVFVSPLVYAFFSALKPNIEIFSMPPTLIGSQIKWQNFAEVFAYGPFWTYIGNSLFVAVAGTLVVLIVSTAAGYAFGRLRWKGRDVVFVLFLATLMVPAEVLVIPMFQVMQWFGWVNTYPALIFPFAFGAFGTFLMRQFFRGIPFELEEAARMDGAGPVRTFLRIILPLSKSAVAVLSVFTFLSFWNSYLWPLIVTVDYATLGTLPVGLASFSGLTGTRWDLQMAAAIISMIPTTLLVIVLQKHLIKGIAMAGLGGR